MKKRTQRPAWLNEAPLPPVAGPEAASDPRALHAGLAARPNGKHPSGRSKSIKGNGPAKKGLPDTPKADPTPAPDASSRNGRRSKRKRIRATVGSEAPERKEAAEELDFKKLLQVVQRIKKSSTYPSIDKDILRKSNQINRILLATYFSENIFREEGLTTGEIELITKALGAPIRRSNIAAQLKRYSALFTFDGAGVPRRGIIMHYRLNEDGRRKIEGVFKGG